jgi:DNA invertase Pin-like site-specific DNA recombinase
MRRPAARKTSLSPQGPIGRLTGYARVSTEDQTTEAQTDELTAAGCDVIFRETGSGASLARPELARLMREIEPGDVHRVPSGR